MLRNRFFAFIFCIVLLFSFSFTTVQAMEATEDAGAENMGWARITCSVPEGFPGTVKVVRYEVDVQEELPYFLREDNEYSLLIPLEGGTYKIAAVTVSGGAEGCFETGFSEEAFEVSMANETPVSIPVYVGIAEVMQGSDDNKFFGMTYAEVMAEIKGTSGSELVNEGATDEAVSTDSAVESSNDEPVIDAKTEEEYYEKVEEYVAQNTEKKEAEIAIQKEKDGIWSSLGIMLVVLMGAAIGFYYLKKNRDL